MHTRTHAHTFGPLLGQQSVRRRAHVVEVRAEGGFERGKLGLLQRLDQKLTGARHKEVAAAVAL